MSQFAAVWPIPGNGCAFTGFTVINLHLAITSVTTFVPLLPRRESDELSHLIQLQTISQPD